MQFEQLDTTVVQVRSLLNFMYALGYTLDETCKTGRFVTNAKTLQGNRYLSAATAAKMHNLPAENWIVAPDGLGVAPTCVTLKSGFTPLGVRIAMASKLVQEVKISVSRHGALIMQDFMVKPLNNIVLDLVEPKA